MLQRRRQWKYMLIALVEVHDIFPEIADLMLAKFKYMNEAWKAPFKDMNEAWKAPKEWCEVLDQIRRGVLRDE